ncbi:MAG TPA: hypothetical protein VGO50_13150 [Pyrinomonadaceae bacterium]|jgi:hypothetical protein|nr:hypothetical protein [Pyrinomonadaceae bacterium]
MKFKTLTFLAILSLAAVLLLGACTGGTSNNNANVASAMNKPTPLPTTTANAVTSTGDKTKIEEALKKAGFSDVTVETSANSSAVLRGTVPKGKTTDMMKVAVEASGSSKPLKNETTEK